jgi:hypothetical protein
MTRVSKHTPGPYEADALPFHRECWAELNDGGPLHIVKRGPDVLAVVWCADDDSETQEAQAALFAAAPDLLEALLTFIEIGDCKASRQEAEAAITKATEGVRA